MKDIPDGSVDLILCDPPYGTTAYKWDGVLSFDKLWEEYNRVLKPNGAAVLFSVQPFTARLINSNPKAFRYCWYWLKNMPTGFAYARYQPMRKVEDICVFYRQMPTYNPQGVRELERKKVRPYRAPKETDLYHMRSKSTTFTNRLTGFPLNVLEYKCERGYHPTQKPVPLLEYLVRTYTNEGDTILDNCMGSGSTGVAVQRVGGRHFIGIEQNKVYFEIAEKRLKEVKTKCLKLRQ